MERQCAKCNIIIGNGDKEIKACRRCKTIFSYQWCSYCEEYLPTDLMRRDNDGRVTSRCVMCDRQRMKKAYNIKAVIIKQERYSVYSKQQHRYQAFINTVSPAFTKGKYMEVYKQILHRHSKCPICGSEHLECQYMIVGPLLGGTYCDLNVLMVCSNCLSRLEKDTNPFISLHPMFNKEIDDMTYYNNFIKACDKISLTVLSK